MHNVKFLPALLGLLCSACVPAQASSDVPSEEALLTRAGDNREQIQRVLQEVPADQADGVTWLLEHMPDKDLQTVSADFLLENARLAYEAWRDAPWHDQVSEDVFLDAILPYACVNEQRDPWRADFRERFGPLVAEARTPGEAAVILNQKIFPMLGVKYSTKRPKPDQSPKESIEAGMASCTGLTVLLVDACRSVGVPARFAGTALWSDGSGNHSWAEVWDDGWHFTGAAEPTGDELDKGWFAGRAAKASREDPRTAIYATTWRKSPRHFPLVWSPRDTSVQAVDVTDRYTKAAEELPAGSARVRFKIIGPDGERLARDFTVTTASGESLVLRSRDEGFDANDHVEHVYPVGTEISWATGGNRMSGFVAEDEQLLTMMIPAEPPTSTDEADEAGEKQSAEAIEVLRRWLARPGDGALEDQPFAGVALTKADDQRARSLLWKAHARRIRKDRRDEMKARTITIGDHSMPFWYTTYGRKPRDGRSLWISMHGGGGAPARVNTEQWENQKRLYEPEEGIYLAPRAPTDTWNLWHQGHIDPLFDRLIENLIVLEDVNPDKIYIIGYSAGGDGVYQLAPRMADRWAAAAMMAGHPNDARPESLRNTAFTLHMGANDTPFKRNEVAAQWKKSLADLKKNDPAGYDHWVEIHQDKGHWMDREDAAAVPWMAERTRNLRPKHVVWRQDDVTHDRSYWLAVDEPVRGKTITATAYNQWILGQTIKLNEDSGPVRIRLDDELFDLDAPVQVTRAGETLHKSVPPRTIGTLHRTLAERGDPNGMFSAEIVVD
jgi:poly(3-hydroxybutyrate) depolymerase